MIKFFRTFLEIVAWLNIFVAISAIFGIFGYVLYKNYNGQLGAILFGLCLLVGSGLGIFISEKIRRSIGCSSLIFRIFSSNDITNLTSKGSPKDHLKDNENTQGQN